MQFNFPSDFIWGVATSSYQIEGAYQADGRKDSIWDVFCRQPGKILNGDSGDLAADHYHRWKEDIAIMALLGIQAYRFSVAWPRIMPEGRGPVNSAGLDFYDHLIDELLKHRIQPMITLYHWDLPQALEEKGGWLSRQVVEDFVNFTSVVFKKYQDRVKFWITHNEPGIVAGMGYGNGLHAPGISDIQAELTVAHHLLLSHGKAVQEMRSLATPLFTGKIGIALNISAVVPENASINDDVEAARKFDQWHYKFYLDPLFKGVYPDEVLNDFPFFQKIIHPDDMKIINHPIDFLGINYYSRTVIRGFREEGQLVPCYASMPPNPYSLMWDYYPQGLKEILEDISARYSPREIYITENGTPVEDTLLTSGEIEDDTRIEYFRSHLKEVLKVIPKVPVKGYFVWSLLDNFEWAHGYSKRFGIVYVDFQTLKRTIKKSGFWYSELIKSHLLQ